MSEQSSKPSVPPPETGSKTGDRLHQMQVIRDFEEKMHDEQRLTVTQARELLGVSKTSWHEYRTGTRDLPEYVYRSIEAHSRLSPFDLECLIDQRDRESET